MAGSKYWADNYIEKRTDAAEAIHRLVRPGNRVFVGSACGEPQLEGSGNDPRTDPPTDPSDGPPSGNGDGSWSRAEAQCLIDTAASILPQLGTIGGQISVIAPLISTLAKLPPVAAATSCRISVPSSSEPSCRV